MAMHILLSNDQTLRYYEELLTYTKSAVTRNYSEKSINNILDYVSSSDDMTFMEKFYQTTLTSLADSKNDVSFRSYRDDFC
jgi:COP9 signalosome complex subunit 2